MSEEYEYNEEICAACGEEIAESERTGAIIPLCPMCEAINNITWGKECWLNTIN